MIIIDNIVPTIPRLKIKPRFLIKFFFFIVYPAAKIIGGKINRKNFESLKDITRPSKKNCIRSATRRPVSSPIEDSCKTLI
jgi:hypothetical protein